MDSMHIQYPVWKGLNFGIPVSFKPYKTIGNIMRQPKDPLSKEQKSVVVYKRNAMESTLESLADN